MFNPTECASAEAQTEKRLGAGEVDSYTDLAFSEVFVL